MEKIILTDGILVTMDAERRILDGYDLIVDGGVIKGIAPSGSLPTDGARRIDCAGCVVLPGLIDCGGWAGTRPFGGWMQEYPALRWPSIAGALVGADEDWWRAEGTALAGSRLLSGVTTGGVHYPSEFFPPDRYADRVKAHLAGYARMGATVLPAVAPEWLGALSAASPAARAYLPSLVASRAGRISDGFSGLSKDDVDRVRAAVAAARAHGVGITAGLWGRQIELLEQAGVRLEGVHWLFQFCQDLTYAEIQRLSALDAAVVHLPAQTVRYAPFSEMLEMGLRCAVMSEDIHSGGSGDLLQAVRRAQMIEQMRFDDMYYLPAGRQLELITIDAARCLGLEGAKGSLEVGKDADVVVVDMEYPRTVPYRDMPVHRLMIDGNVRQVRDVLVGGAQVVTGCRLPGQPFEGARPLLSLVDGLHAAPDEGWGCPVKPRPQGFVAKEVNE